MTKKTEAAQYVDDRFAEIEEAFQGKTLKSIERERMDAAIIHFEDGSHLRFGVTQTGNGILLINGREVEVRDVGQVNMNPNKRAVERYPDEPATEECE